MEEKQPWVTCLFTDILLSYLEESFNGHNPIDALSVFRAAEDFETPQEPAAFLRDVTHWVPLPVFRELLHQSEKVSGRKDVAYRAARAYFEPGRRKLPSLFELIVKVLNDVRSVLICSNLWGSVQTNYLRLQSFARPGDQPDLFMLAQFDETARPTVGAIHLLTGICEGFPRLYPFIENVNCFEEISQLRIEDVAREFPHYQVRRANGGVEVYLRDADEPVVRAVRVPLKSEVVSLTPEFLANVPSALLKPENGKIFVLTAEEETDPAKKDTAPPAYKIVEGGTLTQEGLVYSFENERVYNAPYSRFRFLWEERAKVEPDPSALEVRREISQLLFDHLRQTRESQMRAVQDQIEKRRLARENIELRRQIEREYSFDGIVGQKIRDLYRLVHSVAETDVTVIVQGETGTGKELIARAIHFNSSRRSKRFVAVNCGALSETLLESEIFGHEKGAFTGATSQRKGIFEGADGGSLFLDEIGEITPSTQVKLLRVLQEGEFQRVGGNDSIKVDVRIIAATNQNLEELVQKGRFRQDLYYRLNVFPIMVPPLRERIEDIPHLVSHFIEKRKHSINKKISGVSPQAMALLAAQSWPGNVRELENVIQRMMVVAKAETLDVEDLPGEIRGGKVEAGERMKDLKGISRESSGLVEKNAILDALKKTGQNITHAAKALGISRATLQNKMKLYGLRGIKQ